MITQGEAIAIARQAATERGWRWEEPIRATLRGGWFFFGPERWEVWTAADRLGSQARFVIDATKGTVTQAFWLPR